MKVSENSRASKNLQLPDVQLSLLTQSLLLDDDNCDCLSTLSMGHGMCLAGHSTSYGKANVFGVDKLYDPKCHVPKPSNGLTLYFRTSKPLTITGFGGGWRAFWWWSKDGLWPSGVKDVLQSNYGTCSKYDYYCFQVKYFVIFY